MTELRKIRNPDAVKCEILDQNLKALKLQYQFDLTKKDNIILELKNELDTSNKKAERQKVEITSLSRCVLALEEKLKELRSSQVDIENKFTNNVESSSLNKDDVSKDKIISKLKLALVTANKKAERQKVEITSLSRCVMALEEKLKDLRSSQNKMITKIEDTSFNSDAISKDKIILELKHELEARNKEVERQKTEILKLNCGVDERLNVIMQKIDNLRMSQADVENKLTKVDEGTSTKVMTINGFDYNLFNADDIFNLVSLYGNVVRIKILLKQEHTAMVEMTEPAAVERCIHYLDNCSFGSNSKIKIQFSNENAISEELCPMMLPDHSPSFKNYTSSKNNRFLSAELLTPNKIVRFSNAPPAPPDCTVNNLLKIFNLRNFKPTEIRKFPHRTLKSSTGLIEFQSKADAILAIMRCNNLPIKSKDKTFILHLNFLPGATTSETEK